MSSIDERPAVMLGLGLLSGLAVLTAAVPVVGHVLLGLVALLVVGLVAGFVVAWRRTGVQPRGDRSRSTRPSTPSTASDAREVV